MRKGIQLKIKLIKNSKKHGQSYIEISNRSYNINNIKEIIFDDKKIHIDYPEEKRNKQERMYDGDVDYLDIS